LQEFWMSHLACLENFFNDPRYSDKVLCLTLPPTPNVPKDLESKEPSVLPIGAERSSVQPDSNQEPEPAREVVKKLHVSSVVLSCASRFFAASFASGMSESKEKEFHFQVKDREEAERMENIIRFMYSGKWPSHWQSKENLEALLLCDQLKMDSALSLCCAALEQGLDPETYRVLVQLPAELMQHDAGQKLLAACDQFFVEQFKDFEVIWPTERFLSLSPKDVVNVLQSDEIRVNSENTVYQAAKTWIMRYTERLTEACRKECRESKQKEQKCGPSESKSSTSATFQPKDCSSLHPCPPCLASLASVAISVLQCLRLPLCSASFLRDVVMHDRTFAFEHLPVYGPSVAASMQAHALPVIDSVYELFAHLYVESRAWQEFPGEIRFFRPRTTQYDVRLLETLSSSAEAYVSFFRDLRQQVYDRQQALRQGDNKAYQLPRRFGNRKDIPSGIVDVESIAFGDGMVSEGVGVAKSYLSSSWKVMQWRFPDVMGMESNTLYFSPSWSVDGYVYRLRAGLAPSLNARRDRFFTLELLLDAEATGFSRRHRFSIRTAFNFIIRAVQHRKVIPLNVQTVKFDDTTRYHGTKDLYSAPISRLAHGGFLNDLGGVEIWVRVQHPK